jgi:hypothetical protein
MSENDGQIMDIVGGISLMFAKFILCFWYGFCRYPAGNGQFREWLYQQQSRKHVSVRDCDMEDIRRVCSQYLHDDDAKRFHPSIVWLCFPVVIVEQLVACFATSIATAGCIWNRDEGIRSYGQHLSKSIAGLVIVLGHYLLWMYGDVYCKLAGTASLLMSQKLYNAILFEMGILEFLQSLVLGGAILLTLQEKPRRFRVNSKQVGGNDAKDQTFGLDEDDNTGEGSASTNVRLNIDSLCSMEQNFSWTSGGGQSDEAGARAVADIIELSEDAFHAKEKSGKFPSKTRSLHSFNPLTMLKSATFPKNRETASTPTALRNKENDNVSLDLSYIESGKIETFVGSLAENNEGIIGEESEDENKYCEKEEYKSASRIDAFNAEEILQDLTDTESSKPDNLLESNLVLSAYKATKRRLEEAFYSTTRLHVDGDSNSEDQKERHSNHRMAPQLNQVHSKDSYDFTLEIDQEREVPPILRVFDIDIETLNEDAQDVEVDDNGQILGGPPIEDKQCSEKEDSPRHARFHRKRSGKGMRKLGRQGGSLTGGSNKRMDADRISPPIEHILTDGMGDLPSLDEDLTRNGTWDESIANATSQQGTRPESILRSDRFPSFSLDSHFSRSD